MEKSFPFHSLKKRSNYNLYFSPKTTQNKDKFKDSGEKSDFEAGEFSPIGNTLLSLLMLMLFLESTKQMSESNMTSCHLII